MFKPKRKRAVVKRTTRNESESDDDEEDRHNMNTTTNATAAATNKTQEAKRKKKKKLKKGSALASASASLSAGGSLSFAIDEGDDQDRDHDMTISKKKKKKKGSGFGFGGACMETMSDPTDLDAERVGAAEEKPIAPKVAAGYSKNDLEKLKSLQKVYVAAKEEKHADSHSHANLPLEPVLDSHVPLPPPPTASFPMKPNKPEEEFISFDSFAKHAGAEIMNGDDALKFTGEQNDDFGIDKVQKNDEEKEETQEIEEEGRKWEDEVARRAGVAGSAFSDSNTASVSRHQPDLTLQKDEGAQAIEQIKQTIVATLGNLQQQGLDMDSNMVRKRHDAHVANEDATTKELEESTIGESFEYYQNLRSDLADWTGALRHLSEKIEIIEDALEELYQDMGSRRMSTMKEWEDDAITLLKGNDLVDYIVGRQPIDANTTPENPMVDEFGRDMKSMEYLAISKRKSDRRRKRKESADRRNGLSNAQTQTDTGDGQYEDTDIDISDNELMDRGERRSALGDAIQVTLDEMDESFTSFSSLIALFQNWKSSQPDDFRKHYAGMAIVDFISVFLRCAFCKKLDLLCLGEPEKKYPSLDDFDWFSTFESSSLIPSKSETDDKLKNQPLDLLIEKVCFASIRTCLRGTRHHKNEGSLWSYDPFSKRQTESLSSFCKSALSKLHSKEKTNALASIVFDYINDFLQQKAIVVIRRESNFAQRDTEEFDAYAFACVGQLRCLKRLVINIVNYWYLVFDKSILMARFCIADVMAFRFLPIVQALESGPEEFYGRAKEEFEFICNSFNSLGLLEREELMIMSSPIRAYAAKMATK
jgi:hypothetical protein